MFSSTCAKPSGLQGEINKRAKYLGFPLGAKRETLLFIFPWEALHCDKQKQQQTFPLNVTGLNTTRTDSFPSQEVAGSVINKRK